MKIGMLGTGMVGDAFATKLVSIGHEVMMGSRTQKMKRPSRGQKKMDRRPRQELFLRRPISAR